MTTRKQALPLTNALKLYVRENLRSASPSTLNQYNVTINNFWNSLGRRPTILDLTRDKVLDAMHYLIDRGDEPPTANKLRSNLVAIANFLFDEGKLKKRLKVPRLIEPHRIPIAWTDRQLDLLRETISVLDGEIAGVPARIYWQALINVILDTGERRGAALSLRRDDFDLHTSTVLIRAETRKWKRRDMIHPLRPVTRDFVQALCEVSPASWKHPIFLYGLKPETVKLRYREILIKAGLPHDRKRLFQCLRVTVASHFKKHGGDATKLLDHSSSEITKRYYLDPRVEELDGPAKRGYL